jgi:hypothetical protein
MSRHLLIGVGLLLAALTGCQIDCDPPYRPKSGIDYHGWKSFSEEPIEVEPGFLSLCEDRISQVDQQQAAREEKRRAAAREKNGPHVGAALRFFANEPAMAHLRDGKVGPLPAGAAIVKEKWGPGPTADVKRVLIAYAAMSKREPGYDPDHGDWEYVYVDLGDGGKRVQRGKLQSCIDCHARAAATDYLFRTHLKDEK